MSTTSARVEPDVSNKSAISKGASVVAKFVIFCCAPFSKSAKFSAFSPVSGRPPLFVTTAGTETNCVSTRTTSPSSTSCGVGSPFGWLVVVDDDCSGVTITLRGRCLLLSCPYIDRQRPGKMSSPAKARNLIKDGIDFFTDYLGRLNQTNLGLKL